MDANRKALELRPDLPIARVALQNLAVKR